MNKKRTAWILCVGLCALVMASRGSPQATSTPEERARWVETTRELEINPLDAGVDQQGELVLRAITDAHDIHVGLCPALLSEFNELKSPY